MRLPGGVRSAQTLDGMAQALASSKLTGGIAIVCGVALLPFVYSHLFSARPDGQSLAVAAVDQLKADLAVGPPESWLLIAWLCLPIAWCLAGMFYLRIPGPAPTRSTALSLAALTLVIGGLSVLWCGIGTAPLFLAVPLLSVQMAFRLRPIR